MTEPPRPPAPDEDVPSVRRAAEVLARVLTGLDCPTDPEDLLTPEKPLEPEPRH